MKFKKWTACFHPIAKKNPFKKFKSKSSLDRQQEKSKSAENSEVHLAENDSSPSSQTVSVSTGTETSPVKKPATSTALSTPTTIPLTTTGAAVAAAEAAAAEKIATTAATTAGTTITTTPYASVNEQQEKESHHIGTKSSPVKTPTKPDYSAKNFDQVYTVGKVLGQGNYAIVRQVTKKATGETFAVKMIQKAKLAGIEHSLSREIQILTTIGYHEHIVTLLPEDSFFDTPNAFYLVMRLCTGGELFESITSRGNYTEADARDVVRQILEAVNYCHQKGIVHRDLKPENLLLRDKESPPHILITDFGLSSLLQNEKQMLSTACGTPGYVAPEVLRCRGYSKPADLWSIGCITYVMLCGYIPFWGPNQAALFQEILNCHYEFEEEYWGHISDLAKDFVSKLLVPSPQLRMSAEEALSHPWITSSRGTLPREDLKSRIAHGKKRFKGAVQSIIAANKLRQSFLKKSLAKMEEAKTEKTKTEERITEETKSSNEEEEEVDSDTVNLHDSAYNTKEPSTSEGANMSEDVLSLEEVKVPESMKQSMSSDIKELQVKNP